MNVTAAAAAIAVKDAARPATVFFGIYGCRRAEWLPSKPDRSVAHQLGKTGAAQRRHRVFAPARTLINVAERVDLALNVPSFARDADGTLHRIVIRFELVIRERPVFEG